MEVKYRAPKDQTQEKKQHLLLPPRFSVTVVARKPTKVAEHTVDGKKACTKPGGMGKGPQKHKSREAQKQKKAQRELLAGI